MHSVKLHKLTDFQIYVSFHKERPIDLKRINWNLYAHYEYIRLQIYEQSILSPARKLLITLVDDKTHTKWHGHVTNALSICEVTEAIDINDLKDISINRDKIYKIIMHSLTCIEKEIGWSSKGLYQIIKSIKSDYPYSYNLSKHNKKDKHSGMICSLWMIMQPNDYKIEFRQTNKTHQSESVPIIKQHHPIYLEDDFPIYKTKIMDNKFHVIDKHEQVMKSFKIRTF